MLGCGESSTTSVFASSSSWRQFPPPPQMPPLPSPIWLLTVFEYDVLTRLDEFKARIMSTFGSILKMDSTKTASCVSQFHILHHSCVCLCALTLTFEISLFSSLFLSFPLPGDEEACGCCLRHGLLGYQCHGQVLMIVLICFEGSEGIQLEGRHGMVSLTDAEVIQRISKEEWRLHCRRRTHETEESTPLMQDLLDTFSGPAGHNSLGILLLDDHRIPDIWSTQRCHLSCIQDPRTCSCTLRPAG